ncbi:MAG: flagellar basal body-associated FliL family protein [Gemmatimonadota bacterium]
MTEATKIEAPETEAKKPGKKKMVTMAVVGAAVLLGGGAGAFVIGPRFSHSEAVAPVDSLAKSDPGKPGVIFRIDNLVVNPAGSQGTRFLMISVGFEVANDSIKKRLEEQEVEVRDTVLAALQNETLESLTKPGARDGLKRILGEAVAPLVGATELKVFLPQFVIQ